MGLLLLAIPWLALIAIIVIAAVLVVRYLKNREKG